MQRWVEYDAGTLTPPCVIQHDIVRNEHLIWVWDGTAIHGPLSRPSYDEASVCAEVVSMSAAEVPVVPEPTYTVICDDGFEVQL